MAVMILLLIWVFQVVFKSKIGGLRVVKNYYVPQVVSNTKLIYLDDFKNDKIISDIKSKILELYYNDTEMSGKYSRQMIDYLHQLLEYEDTSDFIDNHMYIHDYIFNYNMGVGGLDNYG